MEIKERNTNVALSAIRLITLSLFASIAIILLEWLVTLQGSSLGFAESVQLLIQIMGLMGLPSFALAGVTCLLLSWLDASWTPALRQPNGPARALAGILCTAFFVIGVSFVVYRVGMFATGQFKTRKYMSLAVALASGGGALAILLLTRPLVDVVARLTGRLNRQAAPWYHPYSRIGVRLYACSVILLVLFGLPHGIPLLHNVDIAPFQLLGVWLLFVVCARLEVWRLVKPRPLLAISAILTVAMVASLFVAAYSMRSDPNVMTHLQRETLYARHVSRLLARLTDGDGDGVSSVFGGGDCNDDDPSIRPGTYDKPDDGVDQNCVGGDLKLADPVFSKPTRKTGLPRQKKNVVLITVDALRYDTMKAHMPKMNALAQASIDFTNAYAHGAATYWSLAALMTSKLPSRLKLGRDQTPIASERLLTEVLRDAGWHTALFANVTVFFVRGLRQGARVANYDTSHFTVHGAKPGSAHMTDGVLKHIDAWQAGKLKPKSDNFFVWAHYYDPHDPYFDVPGFSAEDDSDKAKYEAIARYTDHHLGRLMDGLKTRGVMDDTIVILTADHGDEFMEHGHRFHGSTLYEEMVHVPLLMHVPGLSARQYRAPVGQIEVAPTLLELLGVPVPRQYEGESRYADLHSAVENAEQPVFFEVLPDANYSAHQVGMRLGQLKLIYRVNEHAFELYDLKDDPEEQLNLIHQHPDTDALKETLGRYVDRHIFSLAHGESGARRPLGSPAKRKARKSKKIKKRLKPRQPAGPKGSN